MGSTTGDDDTVPTWAPGSVRFRVLGPVVAMGAVGEPLSLGPPRRRTLLAALLVHANSPLSVDQLTDMLWDGSPPPTAMTMVHGAVAGLRQAFGRGCGGNGPPLLITRDGGYVLDVPPWHVELWEFEQLLARGRRMSSAAPEPASRLLAEALALWRGPALSGIELHFARDAATRWEELRLECMEAQIEAELALGHHADVVAGLADLVARNPFRERLCAQLMVALYRCGRQAEALDASRTLRRTLTSELGVEPGPEMQRLERSILRHCGGLAVPVAPSARTSLLRSTRLSVGSANERRSPPCSGPTALSRSPARAARARPDSRLRSPGNAPRGGRTTHGWSTSRR
jgi:DNA-binding SARP family transcriptional activator